MPDAFEDNTATGSGSGGGRQGRPTGASPGIREIADHLQLSKATVSRALSDVAGPSTRTRQRVLSAARTLGYEANELARSLTVGATKTVGFLARDIASPSLPPILHGAEAVLRAGGYAMLLLDCEGSAELDREHLSLLRRRRVDGLLLAMADEDDRSTHTLLKRLPIPFVAVDRKLPASLGGSAVLIDLESGLRVAGQRLLELGHSRLAFIGGTPNIRPTKETLRVFKTMFEGLGESSFVALTHSFSVEHGLASTRRLLDSARPPTAIVAGNTQILRGVLSATAERGLTGSEAISVLSTDDAPFLELASLPVSVLQIDAEAVGRAAGELLLARLAGGGPEKRTIRTDFQMRGSLGEGARQPSLARARTAS